jgi:WD40 repeat protein
VQRLEGPPQEIHALAFSPDGGRLAVTGTRSVVDLWDLTTGVRTPMLRGKNFLLGVWFLRGGRYLVAGGGPTPLRCRDLLTGSETHARPVDFTGGAAPSRDDTSLIAASSGLDVWQVPDLKRTRMCPPRPRERAYRIALAPNGRRIATVATHERTGYRQPQYRYSLQLRDEAGTVLRTLDTCDADYDALTYSPDGRQLAFVRGPTVVVLSAAGTRARVLDIRERTHFKAVAFHPAGRQLAAANNNGRVHVWDTATWNEAAVYNWGMRKGRALAFSPDGTRAAVGDDKGDVVVWDV